MSHQQVAKRRSENMSRIRGINTKPEMIVRSLLHRLGFRFRVHNKNLPGKPDISLKKYRAIVFVHGCFWHQHEGCKRATIPKTNRNYWKPKLEGNANRDIRHQENLSAIGWRVLEIWECETKDLNELETHLKTFLRCDGTNEQSRTRKPEF